MSTTASNQPIHVGMMMDQLTFDRLGPVVTHLTVGLLDHVSKVTLITPAREAHRLELGPVQVIQHKPPRWFTAHRVIHKIQSQLEINPPTVIHAYSSRSLWGGMALAQRLNRPIIFHLLGAEDTTFCTRGRIKKIDHLIVASEPLMQTVTRKRPDLTPERITLIRPGLLSTHRATSFSRTNVTPTILCMSAFEKTTGVERLIQAVKILHTEGRELMLFLVGKGPQERYLRRMVEENKLINQVVFGQPIADWSIPMRAADLFVVPGIVKRVDVRLLHAMASGLAVVTCDMPNCDFVISEQTALVCSQPTATELAQAIHQLLQDQPLAMKLANQAMEHCRRAHSLSHMIEQTAEIYRQVSNQGFNRGFSGLPDGASSSETN